MLYYQILPTYVILPNSPSVCYITKFPQRMLCYQIPSSVCYITKFSQRMLYYQIPQRMLYYQIPPAYVILPNSPTYILLPNSPSIVWFYQLSWQCKLATVKRFESWRFERQPFVGANRGIGGCVWFIYRGRSYAIGWCLVTWKTTE